MSQHTAANHFLVITFILFWFSSCNDNNPRKIKFVDFAVLNDSTNIYVYKILDFLHESGESYLAIGKSYCDVYNNENTTFAESVGFAQIDTVMLTKVRIASSHEITFYRHPKNLTIETRRLKPMDTLKSRLDPSFFIDTCK